MTPNFEIVTSLEQLKALVEKAPSEVVADVETRGGWPESGTLLGVAVAYGPAEAPVAFYVPIVVWEGSKEGGYFVPFSCDETKDLLRDFLLSRQLVGHNIDYDRVWLDDFCGAPTSWRACTRKMWHLSDSTDALHGFGLKTAQTEILGWEETNEGELQQAVEQRGGKLSNGDHYLAPLQTLGKYACLDALSTLLLYHKLSVFFDRFDYWDFLAWRLDYHTILTRATRFGCPVDAEVLFDAHQELILRREEVEKEIVAKCPDAVALLERRMAEEEAVKRFKKLENREKFLKTPSRWRKFNPGSTKQKARLFHEVLGLPVVKKTPTGNPATDREAISKLKHPVAEEFSKLSDLVGVLNLANQYINCLKEKDGKYYLQFPYNTSATVSDRLGGFKPYALNMPFSEEALMRAFKVPEGYIGVHADISSLEPCLIAALSDDPTLMKVNRDGLGDVYLDFALIAFPDNEELKRDYDPYAPVTEEIKKRFKSIRNICKVVHLALGYSGTEYTVARNTGLPLNEARRLVNRYWDLFEKVADLDYRLKELHKRQGYLRNIVGRVLQVPPKFAKDTLNRMIQSSGHDCLTMWVKDIDELAQQHPEIDLIPFLPDIHDSTSWIVKEEHYEKAKWIFEEGLRRTNARLGLSVQLRAEVKPFRTLAGLKGDEA